MRSILLSIILFLGIGSLNPANAQQGDKQSAEAALNNIDAIQAMAIANQWKWTKRKIKSHVTPREVIFKFPNGRVKTIPIPKDKMVVAVAPYISRTHR